MPSIVIAGAGGHAGVVIDIIKALGGRDIVGLIERAGKTAESAHGFPVIGADDILTSLHAKGVAEAANGVGSVRDNGPRRAVFQRLKDAGFAMPALVHPTAWVADSVKLGGGVQLMAGVLVQRGAQLAENVLVNTGAIVEHDCRVLAHAHICSGARLGGDVVVGDSAFVGAGTTIRQGIRIGDGALVGAGSVVVDDIPDGARVAGVPARPMR